MGGVDTHLFVSNLEINSIGCGLKFSYKGLGIGGVDTPLLSFKL